MKRGWGAGREVGERGRRNVQKVEGLKVGKEAEGGRKVGP